MTDEKEQELLKKKKVVEGSDKRLFENLLASHTPREKSEEEKLSYEQRMARLHAAFERNRKKKLALEK